MRSDYVLKIRQPTILGSIINKEGGGTIQPFNHKRPLWQWIRYSYKPPKSWGRWLQTWFEIGHHLTLIACISTYQKWVSSLMLPLTPCYLSSPLWRRWWFHKNPNANPNQCDVATWEGGICRKGYKPPTRPPSLIAAHQPHLTMWAKLTASTTACHIVFLQLIFATHGSWKCNWPYS